MSARNYLSLGFSLSAVSNKIQESPQFRILSYILHVLVKYLIRYIFTVKEPISPRMDEDINLQYCRDT